MKIPTSYYKEYFGHDLLAIRKENRISIVNLLHDGLNTAPFNGLEFQRLFLFSYFFTSLIDQAIHASLREEHPYFDRLACYPKFVGVLGTYFHNIHPCLLLLTATLYTNKEDQTTATDQFCALSDFFADDYEDFFLNKYPPLTGRLQNEHSKKSAVRKIYSEISNALALLFIPRSLRPYSSLSPDIELYKKWVGYFATKINSKLKDYRENII